MEKAKAVIDRISSLGLYFCNIKEPASQDFLMEKFAPLAEFAERFPADLSPRPTHGYGDVFCVIDPNSIRPTSL